MSTLPRSLLRWKGSLSLVGELPDMSSLVSKTVDLALHHADWRGAPPNLERISSYIVIYLASNDHSWLPRSLCEGQIQIGNKSAFSSDVARTLPPLTSDLSLFTIDERLFTTNWMTELPKALQSLYFASTSAGLNSLAYLPRTLTKLHIGRKYSEIFDLRSLISNAKAAETFWPPTLDHLEWDFDLPCDDFDLLPKSTRDLTVRLADPASDTTTKGLIIDAKLLPPKLTSLSLFGGSSHFVTIMGQYPSGLRLIDTSLLKSGLDERTIESLPDSLINLILGQGTALFHPTRMNLLPTSIPCSITSLRVARWRCDHFGLVPRTLQMLKIGDLIVHDEQSTLIVTGRIFEDLPVSLTSLKVRAGIELEIPLQRVSHLVNLQFLHLKYNTEMSALALRELPPLLTELSIPIFELSDEDVSFIPPGLTHLKLGDPYSLIITQAIIQHWPLRAINDLEIYSVSPEHHKSLRKRIKASSNPYSH